MAETRRWFWHLGWPCNKPRPEVGEGAGVAVWGVGACIGRSYRTPPKFRSVEIHAIGKFYDEEFFG